MKHTSTKLVLTLCGILTASFVSILLIFHCYMSDYIRTTATQAVQASIDELKDSFADENSEDNGEDQGDDSSEDDEEPTAVAYWLLVDENYSSDNFYVTREEKLIDWCREHPDTTGNVRTASVSQRTYYVAQVLDKKNKLDTGDIWILYVDVTAKQALMTRVDLSMLVVMILCAAIACVFGTRIGVSIERENERQKMFFENASHELKTPLMSIQGYAEGIYDGYFPDSKAAVSVIMSEADKMTALVDGILCLSRIESGDIKLHLENIALDTVINDCLISLESVIKKKNLRVEMQPTGATVLADTAQIDTAITNLLSNAVKYAKELIVIRSDERSLSIWNDGESIPEEDLPHIFDRFYIGKNGGTGIGLALTKEIVNRHGWEIVAELVDGGTRFTVGFFKHRRG